MFLTVAGSLYQGNPTEKGILKTKTYLKWNVISITIIVIFLKKK